MIGRPPIVIPRMIEAVSQAGAQGITAPNVWKAIDGSRRSIYTLLCRLAADGRLFKEGGHRSRYFATAEFAKEWATSPERNSVVKRRTYQNKRYAAAKAAKPPKPPRAPKPPKAKPVKVVALKQAAPRPASRGPAHIDGPGITTANTRYVVYPTRPWPLRTGTHSVY